MTQVQITALPSCSRTVTRTAFVLFIKTRAADSPETLQRGVELHAGRRDGRAVQPDVVGRRHGHQALDPGQGHGAVLGGAHQAAADAVLAVVLRRRGEDAVGSEALHGQGHAVCRRHTEQIFYLDLWELLHKQHFFN